MIRTKFFIICHSQAISRKFGVILPREFIYLRQLSVINLLSLHRYVFWDRPGQRDLIEHRIGVTDDTVPYHVTNRLVSFTNSAIARELGATACVFTKSVRNHINFYINIINWKTELSIGIQSHVENV